MKIHLTGLLFAFFGLTVGVTDAATPRFACGVVITDVIDGSSSAATVSNLKRVPVQVVLVGNGFGVLQPLAIASDAPGHPPTVQIEVKNAATGAAVVPPPKLRVTGSGSRGRDSYLTVEVELPLPTDVRIQTIRSYATQALDSMNANPGSAATRFLNGRLDDLVQMLDGLFVENALGSYHIDCAYVSTSGAWVGTTRAKAVDLTIRFDGHFFDRPERDIPLSIQRRYSSVLRRFGVRRLPRLPRLRAGVEDIRSGRHLLPLHVFVVAGFQLGLCGSWKRLCSRSTAYARPVSGPPQKTTISSHHEDRSDVWSCLRRRGGVCRRVTCVSNSPSQSGWLDYAIGRTPRRVVRDDADWRFSDLGVRRAFLGHWRSVAWGPERFGCGAISLALGKGRSVKAAELRSGQRLTKPER
jgi:hypothetical protein